MSSAPSAFVAGMSLASARRAMFVPVPREAARYLGEPFGSRSVEMVPQPALAKAATQQSRRSLIVRFGCWGVGRRPDDKGPALPASLLFPGCDEPLQMPP